MMRRSRIIPVILLGGLCGASVTSLRAEPQAIADLTPRSVTLAAVEYRGRRAVRMTESGVPGGDQCAVVKDVEFHNGTIDVDLAGQPAAGAPATARGFIGVAFRMRDGKYEHIYLRPTNGRADDQVRRNHSTQYSSVPDFDFARLRRDAPEKYESYVDLEAGAWTHYRVVVQGVTARLFVHGAPQPALVVNDLKLGDISGGVALCIGPGTEGHFSGLKIEHDPRR